MEERTAKFGEAVIRFCKRVPVNPVTMCLITQLVKAASSVGANYGKANDAESKKDFATRSAFAGKNRKNRSTFYG